MAKPGRLSKADQSFISKNADTMSDAKIAETLDKSIDAITGYRKRFIGLGDDHQSLVATLRFQLTKRPYWSDIKKQFTSEEIKLFEYHWSTIIGQFKEDVLPTEELQILDLIRFEILISRNLKDRMRAIRHVNSLEVTLSKEYEKEPKLPENIDRIMRLEDQVNLMTASQESRTRDHEKLQTRKDSIFKELKATRNQRIQRLEDSKTSFLGWMKSLEDERIRQDMSFEAELAKLAMNNEMGNLQDEHQYIDGDFDAPYLTPELIDDQT